MKRKTILFSSLLTILFTTGLIVGATYSLFTSESTHNITVGSGTVNVVSEVDQETMELYSMGERQGSTFANGGTATLIEGGTIKLDKITPGDSIKFKVRIKNESNVAVKYKVSISKLSDDFANVLEFRGPTVDLWETLPPKSVEPYEGILTNYYEIYFPDGGDSDNNLQNLTTSVQIKVEAIQANAPIAQTYQIKFHSKFGSFETLNYQPSENIEMPTVPNETGYTFEGWYTTEDYKEGTKFELTEMPMENVDLYAKWTLNKYTIQFEENGGSLVSDLTQVGYNSEITLPTSTKEGHQLDGWYKDNNKFAQKVSYTTMPAENLTLYAKWNVNNYDLVLHTNGGTIEGETTRPTAYNSVLSLPTPTKVGHTFNHWCTDADLLVQNTITNMPASTLNLYAKYTVNEVTLTFDSNEGTAVQSIKENYNTPITAPEDPYKVDLEFAGWFTDDVTFNNEFTFSTMPATDTTLYAKWVPIDVSNYEFTHEDTDQNAQFKGFKGPNTKSTIHLPTIGHTQYSDEEIGIIGKNAFENHTEVTKVILPTKLDTIGAYAFKGSGISDIVLPETTSTIENNAFQDCANLKEIVLPNNLIDVSNNAFEGCTDLVIKVTNVNMIKARENYWAKGMGQGCRVLYGAENFDDNNTYTINYNNEGTVETKTVIHGGKLEHPTYIKDGYTFKGWYLDPQFNTKLDTAFMPKDGLTVYAKWEKDIVYKTISFETNSPTSSIKPLTAAVGSTISAPSEPTKDGHWFEGWYSDSSLKTPYEFTTMPDTNKTIYAKWEKDIFTYEETQNGAAYFVIGVIEGENVGATPKLPTNHNGKPVVGVNSYYVIADNWVQNVDIPRGYTSLSKYCMQGNDNLKKVFIPNTVTDVAELILNNGNTHVFVEHPQASLPSGWHSNWCGGLSTNIHYGATHQDYLDCVV